ncbi:MAG: hypothetical protein ACW99Q_27365, partial [Candidatus Kariarchaeaceae archaeon]
MNKKRSYFSIVIFLLLILSLLANYTNIQGTDTQVRFEAWDLVTTYDGSCGGGNCHGGGSGIIGSGSITLAGTSSVSPSGTFTLDLSVSGFTQASNGLISFGVRNQDGDNSQFMGATSSFFERRHAIDSSGNSVSAFTTPSFTAPSTPGSYTIEALAIDWDGNSVHYYLIGQKTITVVSQAPTITSPNDITYEHGSTGNNVSWTGTDNNPDIYIVYRNDTQVSSGSWTSGTPINVNVDSLGLGIYNYTMMLTDLNSNSVTDLVWVTVEDTISPVISTPNDVTYEHGSTGNSLSWTATDNNADNYSIYLDSVLVDSGSWTSGTPITISIDNLATGIYNYTIIVSDLAFNTKGDLVWVTVEDTVSPLLTNPSDITYEEGNIGNSLSWIATDNNPDSYVIYSNESLVDSGTWVSGTPVAISVDGLTLGIYNYTIFVNDTSGNANFDTAWITVQDTASPSISQPSNITYEHGSTGNMISWTAIDSHEENYDIYQNGINVDNGTWTSGVPIVLNIDGLIVGTYNFTIVVSDTSGNN